MKYGNVRTDGRASKLENAVYQILKFKEKAKLIRDISEQANIDLGCGIFWKCDFKYYDCVELDIVYAEAKGIETERFRLCMKLWADHGPGKLLIYKGSWKDPRLIKIIEPKK